jgi:hypothetical protein
MKIYIAKSNIDLSKITPQISVYDEYYTLDGIYKIKNNKIIKYLINDNESSKVIKTFINDLDCFISYDYYQYDSTHYHIPNEHIKMTINCKTYRISDKLMYVVEQTGNKKDEYFKSDFLLSDPNLKEEISTLIL